MLPIIKRKHNNINKKINTFFINKYIIDLIKKNSIKNDISLKKLSHNFIYKLNKPNNERLLDMKISDIFIEQDISSKYTNYVKDYNRHLINKIYEEKKEIKDKIKGLDLLEENNNYKDVEYLIQKIKSKDKYDSDYIEKFIRACYDYNERT